MENKRVRMTAQEVDFICSLRKEEKTHKDYNTATGRDNWLFRLTEKELMALSAYRTGQGVINNEIKAPAQSKLLFGKIMTRYSEKEIQDIANGHSSQPIVKAANIAFTGLRFKWMQISDTHLGSKFTNPADIVAAFKHAEEEGCQMITHVGDIFEGMSGREGHIYELSEIGYTAQLELGRQVFATTKLPVNAISGNHDEWFIKSNGAYIVKELCDTLPNLNYLGQNYGTIYLNGARYELTHGLDGGGSYAISYRVQKIIEAYEGGQKPQIIGTGHDHKAGYFFLRNVHAFLGGCMQNQSDWMRQTRKSAMKGYWIIDALIDDSEVKTVKMQFVPFYR